MADNAALPVCPDGARPALVGPANPHMQFACIFPRELGAPGAAHLTSESLDVRAFCDKAVVDKASLCHTSIEAGQRLYWRQTLQLFDRVCGDREAIVFRHQLVCAHSLGPNEHYFIACRSPWHVSMARLPP
jgi:hypothetical protein